MSQHTQKSRSARVQQLQRSEDRQYTSFNELGIQSPRQEEFEHDRDDDNGSGSGSEGTGASNQEMKAEPAGKAEGAVSRRETEGKKAEGATRERSGSMRLVMEWFVRPKTSPSPP